MIKKLLSKFKRPKRYGLLLTLDVRVKADVHAYYQVIGGSLCKRNWYLRKILLGDAMTKQKSKSVVYLEVVSQKDNILLVEARNGLISK